MAFKLSHRTLAWAALVGALFGAIVVASCGGGNDGAAGDNGGAGAVDPSDLALTPEDEVLVIDLAEELPTLDYRVTNDGVPVDGAWSVDRPDLAEIDAEGVLTPTGRGAGVVTVTAEVGGATISTTVTLEIRTVQNGPGATTPGAEPGTGTPADYEAGRGGFMGVGGEGIGGAVSDELAAVLTGAPTADAEMEFLYPYDGTVWPLGMLAPLLMWNGSDAAGAEAVMITLSADGFEYSGMFGRPAALGAAAPFVRHPIPNDVWQAATRSAAGGTLTVSLVVARDGQAYGPITETWKVAESELLGCVYYDAYFTNFVSNEHGALGSRGDAFGGATLGIRPGGTDPVLVAGYTSEDKSGCRVCHSVSANGARMVVQHGDDYPLSGSVDLQNGYEETVYPDTTAGTLAWIGMTPDGALGVGNSATLPGDASQGPTDLYDMETGEVVPSTGLTDFATHAGMPAFSHDGAMLAFNFWDGPGDAASGEGNERKLVVMDFDGTDAFTNPRLLWEGDIRPMWPSFFPDGTGLVFQTQIEERMPEAPDYVRLTGGQGELWWVHLTGGDAAALERANGTENGTRYLPTGPDHPNDAILNYEPNVAPVTSGGYAWVVFVSRRLYGNVITAPPYASDPRYHDLTLDYSPKKLWIAAIDLNAAPGTDPSHPAIYLPAQEIQASNSRGFWTSDPCVYTGQM